MKAEYDPSAEMVRLPRHRPNRGKRQHKILLLIATAVTALTGACGKDSASAALGEGEYCKAARAWAVHELEPRHDEDPSWLKTYWGEYLEFVAIAKRTAPEAIRAHWQTYGAQIDAQTAVLAKYGYDMRVGEEKATADEKKVFEEPSEEAQAAFGEILTFEALTCDAGQPPAAEVDFSGEKPGAWCEALAADKELFGAVKDAGMPPDKVREVVNSPEAKAIVQKLRDTAPPSIKADVEAVTDWQQGQQRDVLAANDYDMRAILLHGSPKERQALQLTDEAIRTPFARTVAYEQQVCGA